MQLFLLKNIQNRRLGRKFRKNDDFLETITETTDFVLTLRLAAWPLRGHTALSNFLEDILQPTKFKMSPKSNLRL